MLDFSGISRLIGPMMEGTGVTLTLFALTLLISIPVGIIMALGKMSKLAPLRFLVQIYVWLFRGTPLLLQLFFIYYGLGTMNVLKLDMLPAAVLTFSLNYAAYFAEIFRAGIQSIDKGQYEAADVLGLSKIQTFFKVISPQMIKRILPPLSNEVITLVKDTALVSAIGLGELLRVAKAQATSTFNFTPYLVAAVFYLVMTFTIERIFKYLEDRHAYYR